MLKKIERPSNPYSPLWSLYWEQNPTLRRGVGAEATEEEKIAAQKVIDDEAAAQKATDDAAAAQKVIDDAAAAEAAKGKGGPSDEEAKLLKEVMQKKEKLKTQETELTDLKSKLKAFDGIDLEQVSKLVKNAAEVETKKLEDKGAWDKLKTQMVEQQETEKNGLKTTIEELTGKLNGSNETINKLTVGHAFDASKYIGEKLTLTPGKARIIYGLNFDVEDGVVIAFDKPKGASGRTPLVDSSGNGLGFEAAIQKIVDSDPDRDHMVKSQIKPGADSKTNNDKVNKKDVPLTGMDRIAAALDNAKNK